VVISKLQNGQPMMRAATMPKRTNIPGHFVFAASLLWLASSTLADTNADNPPADPQPQGLYSASNLIGAPVYAADNAENIEGAVTDMLLDEDMQLAGLLVTLNEDEQPRFIPSSGFAVATHAGDSVEKLSYVVFLGEDIAKIKASQPADDDWWQTAREMARESWEATRDTASSAWQDGKQGASNLFERGRDTTGEMIENLRKRFE